MTMPNFENKSLVQQLRYIARYTHESQIAETCLKAALEIESFWSAPAIPRKEKTMSVVFVKAIQGDTEVGSLSLTDLPSVGFVISVKGERYRITDVEILDPVEGNWVCDHVLVQVDPLDALS